MSRRSAGKKVMAVADCDPARRQSLRLGGHRSMTRKLFGTDGIRGVANVDPMTGEMAIQLGRAIAHLFREVKGRHRIVIGKDTRLSGYMLEQHLPLGSVLWVLM